MTSRRLAVVAIALTVLGTVFGTAVLVYRQGLTPELRTYRTGLAEQIRELGGQAESVSDGAVYQRFQARRAAVAAMKADLRRLVAAESAIVADSGYPSAHLGAPYWTGPSRGNMGPWIHITRNGWWATLSSTVTAIHCAVSVGGDYDVRNGRAGRAVVLRRKGWMGVQQ